MAGWSEHGGTRTTAAQGTRPASAERGAILVQTAIMLVGLTAFGAFIVDYGVLWTARRQAQNAADSAALAAAISLGFDAPGDYARASQNALATAAQNLVWGDVASVTTVAPFPCPSSGGKLPPGEVCVRVEARRNLEAGNPLPTIFARLVDVPDQGVRATATARVLYGSSADCLRPMAIPDRWQELRGGPPDWDQLDTFERYVRPGGVVLLTPPLDYYEPPGGAGANGTGYSRGPTGTRLGDYGASVQFAPAVLPGRAGNSSFVPVRVSLGGSFASDLAGCVSRVISPGYQLSVESNVAGVFAPWVTSRIAEDPDATWSTAMNGGRGGVSGGCMATGECTISPRIIALPVFDPDLWDRGGDANDHVDVTRMVGFFIANLAGVSMVGRLMVYPVEPGCKMAAVPYDCSTMTADPQSAFVVSTALVR